MRLTPLIIVIAGCWPYIGPYADVDQDPYGVDDEAAGTNPTPDWNNPSEADADTDADADSDTDADTDADVDSGFVPTMFSTSYQLVWDADTRTITDGIRSDGLSVSSYALITFADDDHHNGQADPAHYCEIFYDLESSTGEPLGGAGEFLVIDLEPELVSDGCSASLPNGASTYSPSSWLYLGSDNPTYGQYVDEYVFLTDSRGGVPGLGVGGFLDDDLTLEVDSDGYFLLEEWIQIADNVDTEPYFFIVQDLWVPI